MKFHDKRSASKTFDNQVYINNIKTYLYTFLNDYERVRCI